MSVKFQATKTSAKSATVKAAKKGAVNGKPRKGKIDIEARKRIKMLKARAAAFRAVSVEERRERNHRQLVKVLKAGDAPKTVKAFVKLAKTDDGSGQDIFGFRLTTERACLINAAVLGAGKEGATVAELATATGLQPVSIRPHAVGMVGRGQFGIKTDTDGSKRFYTSTTMAKR